MEGFLYFAKHMKPFFIFLSTCLKILKKIFVRIIQQFVKNIKSKKLIFAPPKPLKALQINLLQNEIFFAIPSGGA